MHWITIFQSFKMYVLAYQFLSMSACLYSALNFSAVLSGEIISACAPLPPLPFTDEKSPCKQQHRDCCCCTAPLCASLSLSCSAAAAAAKLPPATICYIAYHGRVSFYDCHSLLFLFAELLHCGCGKRRRMYSMYRYSSTYRISYHDQKRFTMLTMNLNK